MTPLNVFVHGGGGAGENSTRPSSARNTEQRGLLELRKHSALFGDLGKHLRILGELVEKEVLLSTQPHGTLGSQGLSGTVATRCSSSLHLRKLQGRFPPRSDSRPATPHLAGDSRSFGLASVLEATAAVCDGNDGVNSGVSGTALMGKMPCTDKHKVTFTGRKAMLKDGASCNLSDGDDFIRSNLLPATFVSSNHFASGRIQLPVSAVQDQDARGYHREVSRSELPALRKAFMEHDAASSHIEHSAVVEPRPQTPTINPPAFVSSIDEDIEVKDFQPAGRTVLVENGSDVDGLIEDVQDSDVSCSTDDDVTNNGAKGNGRAGIARKNFRRTRSAAISVVIATLERSKGSSWSENTPRSRDQIGKVLYDTRFEAVLAFLVVANALLLGLQADEAIHDHEPTFAYYVISKCFSCAFFVELLLRVHCERLFLFNWNNPNVTWNALDTIVVSTAVFEEVLHFSGYSETTVNVSVMRLLRLMRVARMLRTAKLLRYFRDLRVMIIGILRSCVSLVWALVLLALLMYLTAVLIVEVLGTSKIAKDSRQTMAMFGSVTTSLYTLYSSVLGGIDWNDAADPLFTVDFSLGCAFSFYVSFSMLCVLNIITGVFVENANRITAQSHEEVLLDQLSTRKQYIGEAKEVIARFQVGGSINEDQFENLLGEIEFQAILRKLDVQLEPKNARSLFNMLDFGQSGSIQVEELVNRLDRVHGVAKGIDIQRLVHSADLLHEKMDCLANSRAFAPPIKKDKKRHMCSTWTSESAQ